MPVNTTCAKVGTSRQGSVCGMARSYSPECLLSSKFNVRSNSSGTFIYHPSTWLAFIPSYSCQRFSPEFLLAPALTIAAPSSPPDADFPT